MFALIVGRIILSFGMETGQIQQQLSVPDI
jgi:hypothetical protein